MRRLRSVRTVKPIYIFLNHQIQYAISRKRLASCNKLHLTTTRNEHDRSKRACQLTHVAFEFSGSVLDAHVYTEYGVLEYSTVPYIEYCLIPHCVRMLVIARRELRSPNEPLQVVVETSSQAYQSHGRIHFPMFFCLPDQPSLNQGTGIGFSNLQRSGSGYNVDKSLIPQNNRLE